MLMLSQLIAAAAASRPATSIWASVAMAAQSTSGADLATLIKPFTPDALANGFVTLIGVLVGAMLAYALQRLFQQSIEHKKNLTSAHRLMFALLQQINTIVLIQRDYFHKEIANPGRFLFYTGYAAI